VPRKYPYEHHSQYAAWKPTPVPNSWRTEGDASWMYCPPFPSETVSHLAEAAKTEGSYYTAVAHDNQRLLVAPKLGLIVYAYFD